MKGIVSTFKNITTECKSYFNGNNLSGKHEYIGIKFFDDICYFNYWKVNVYCSVLLEIGYFCSINTSKTKLIKKKYKPVSNFLKNIPSKKELKFNLEVKSFINIILIFKINKIPKCLYMNLILNKFFIKIEFY